jgi:hypothetical protein
MRRQWFALGNGVLGHRQQLLVPFDVICLHLGE